MRAKPPAPSRRLLRALRLVLVALLCGLAPGAARGPLDAERMIAGVRMFYGPRDNLQAVDLALIARARETIDMAAFILTDRAIMEALSAAARRGVKVRLYLDADQPALRGGAGAAAMPALLATPGVEARIKGADHLMHLKAILVDRRVLRTGSSNFSRSGGLFQDNDVLVLEGSDIAARFLREFEFYWSRPDNAPVPAGRPFAAGARPQGAVAND